MTPTDFLTSYSQDWLAASVWTNQNSRPISYSPSSPPYQPKAEMSTGGSGVSSVDLKVSNKLVGCGGRGTNQPTANKKQLWKPLLKLRDHRLVIKNTLLPVISRNTTRGQHLKSPPRCTTSDVRHSFCVFFFSFPHLTCRRGALNFLKVKGSTSQRTNKWNQTRRFEMNLTGLTRSHDHQTGRKGHGDGNQSSDSREN